MGSPSEPWWIAEGLELRNGVFQGGGAKGIAYVGAVRAFRCRGLWFSAVAGSSAGAITATMIAAGLKPEEMQESTEAGLGSIRRPRLIRKPREARAFVRTFAGHISGLVGDSGPIYPTSRLRNWIEQRLRDQYLLYTGTDWAEDCPSWVGHEDVTFAGLANATKIDLFIVALDITGGVPVVLSQYSAPDCQVSWAAVASSSMPLFMRKQRLLLTSDEKWGTVELIDGGAWANYPRFVFEDESFGSYHRIPRHVRERQTVGFILKSLPAAEAEQLRRQPHFGRFVSNLPGGAGGSRDTPKAKPETALATSDEGPHSTSTPVMGTSRFRRLRVYGAFFLLTLAIGIGAYVGMSLLRAEVGLWHLAELLIAGAVAGVGLWLLRGEVRRAFLNLARKGVVDNWIRIFGIGFVAFVALTGLYSIPGTIESVVDRVGGWSVLGFLGYFALLVLYWILCATAVVAIAALVVFFFHGFLAKDAPRIADAVLGAATRVPDWVGYDPSHFVIRVPVEPKITTTAFAIDEDVTRRVIDNAYRSTLRQIDLQRRGAARLTSVQTRPARLPSDKELREAAFGVNHPRTSSLTGRVVGISKIASGIGVVLLSVGLSIWWFVPSSDEARVAPAILIGGGVIFIVVGLAAFIFQTIYLEGGTPSDHQDLFVPADGEAWRVP